MSYLCNFFIRTNCITHDVRFAPVLYAVFRCRLPRARVNPRMVYDLPTPRRKLSSAEIIADPPRARTQTRGGFEELPYFWESVLRRIRAGTTRFRQNLNSFWIIVIYVYSVYLYCYIVIRSIDPKEI